MILLNVTFKVCIHRMCARQRARSLHGTADRQTIDLPHGTIDFKECALSCTAANKPQQGGTAPHPGDNEATIAPGVSDNIPGMPQ